MKSNSFLSKLKGRILWMYFYLVYATSKISFFGRNLPEFFQEYDHFIGAALHRDLFVLPFTLRDTPGLVLVSSHPNEDAYAKLLECWSYSVVRGCTVEGGHRAIFRMKQWLKTHCCGFVGLAVDGPYGPSFHAKKGAVFLAKIFDIPLLPIVCRVKYYIKKNTWDERILPLPFNQINVMLGTPIEIAPPYENMAELKVNQLNYALKELDKKLRQI